MLKSLAVATRDRERLREISAIAARFGLQSLAIRLGIGEGRSERGDGGGGGEESEDLPARTRAAMEALGPTFVKLGQILATRRDLLPGDWIAAFQRLQDQAPTLPFADLRGQVEASLGAPPEDIFAHFDTTPLAAASIAQVHRARLSDGTEVVVKIRRPGIRAAMEADLRLLRHFAQVAEAGSANLRRMRPRALIEQLGQDILDELDFTSEGRNADLLRANLAGMGRVVVPRIHWPLSGADLLVMDYVEGVPPRDAQSLEHAGIDPARIAALSAELVLEMVLVNGRFHADPHPGNLLCQRGAGGEAPRLALLDLGSVGTVSPRRQNEFLGFMMALRNGDPVALADVLSGWSQGEEVPREVLDRAAERLVARHGRGPLVLGNLVADFFPLLRKVGLVLPGDLVLMFKAMVTMDGVLSGIAPDFDLAAAFDAMRARLLANRLAAIAGPQRIESALVDLAALAEEAPRLMRAAAARLEVEPEQAGADQSALAGAVRQVGWLVAGAIVFHALAGWLPGLS